MSSSLSLQCVSDVYHRSAETALTLNLFVQLAMKACPYRATFYEKLGTPADKVEKELQTWLAALEQIVTRLEKFYEAGNQCVSRRIHPTAPS